MAQATLAQQRAIDTRNTNILLSASAGSGKTFVLVERLLKMVLEENVSLDRVVAMTFTKKAASEMKDRLRQALSKQAHLPGIQKQLSLLERAYICTIDSFCASIVKQYYYLLPISYQMATTTLEEAQARILRHEAFMEALKEADQDLLNYIGEGQLSLEDIEKWVFSALTISQSQADPDAWFELDPSCCYQKAQKDLLKKLGLLCQQLDHPFFEQKAQACFELLKEDITPESLRPFVIHYTTNPRQSGVDKNLLDLTKKIEERLLSQVVPMSANPLKPAFTRLVKRVHEAFQAKKKAHQCMDFVDLERFAYILLQKPIVAQTFRQQIDAILVDEYQDSNQLQESIIQQFARENNVFRVGDTKQSIYGFRQADPSIMKAIQQTKDDNNLPLLLNHNFRSDPAIIEFNNRFYERLMKDTFTEEDVALVPEGKQDRLEKPLRFLTSSEDKVSLLDGLVQDILEQVDQGFSLSDICILTRTHGTQRLLVEHLARYGLPAVSDDKTGFFKNDGVQIILNCLLALTDPQNTLAVAGALHSPIINESWSSIYHGVQLPEWFVSLRLPLPKLLSFLYQTNRFYLNYCDQSDQAHLDALLELASRYEAPYDLAGFVNKLSQEASLDAIAPAYSFDVEADVIKIKTIHQSKGLQFPLVYLYCDQARIKQATDPFLCHPKLGFDFMIHYEKGRYQERTQGMVALASQLYQDTIEEEIRLMYVATTRPIHGLTFVARSKQENFGFEFSSFEFENGKTYSYWAERLSGILKEDVKPVLKQAEPIKQGDRLKIEPKQFETQRFVSKIASHHSVLNEWPILHLEKGGLARGTLMHELVASLSYPYDCSEVNIDQRAKQQIEALNHNEAYQIWMSHPHEFEASFVVKRGQELWHGSIDLLVHLPDRIVIVDFKSDVQVTPEQLKERYAHQLYDYRKALSKIEPGLPIDCVIYNFWLGQNIFL